MMHKNAAILMGMLGFAALSLVHPCAAVAEEKSLPSNVLMPALRVHHAGKLLAHMFTNIRWLDAPVSSARLGDPPMLPRPLFTLSFAGTAYPCT